MVCPAAALERYGEQVGAAFQIIDDVLDLMGDPAVVGKSLGKDLEKGKLTLPLIHHLATAEQAERSRLLELLENGAAEAAPEIGRLLAASDSLAYARARAAQLVAEAKDELVILPSSAAQQVLRGMADAVLTRQF